jgi:hypothetical protein
MYRRRRNDRHAVLDDKIRRDREQGNSHKRNAETFRDARVKNRVCEKPLPCLKEREAGQKFSGDPIEADSYSGQDDPAA